jgi:ubiquitin-conjugating enzyme E2 O
VLCVGGAVVHAEQGDLTVVDRSWLRPSHMVVSASDPGGQVGVVVGVDTVVDLVELEGRGGGGLVARGVPPAELRRVTELSMGDYVTSGPWLGRVVELSVDVDVLFDDGAACRVRAAEGKLKSVSEDRKLMMRQYNGFYYPGRRVAAAAKVFEAARWLNGHFKLGVHVQGTVAKVKLASVLVQWVASAPSIASPSRSHRRRRTSRGLATSPSSAPTITTGPSATVASSVTHAAMDLGGLVVAAMLPHRLIITIFLPRWRWRQLIPSGRSGSSPSPSSAPVVEPTKQQQQLRKSFFRRHSRARQRRRERRHAAFERPMSVAGTRTTAVVLWQDGTRQRGVLSASLSAFISHVIEFVPGHRVISGGAVEPVDGDSGQDDAGAAARRRGVVRSFDFRDRTARVAWLKAAPPGEEPSDVERDETVSAYDLNMDYDHAIFYGDLVVRLLPSSESDGGEDLLWVGHVVDLCGAHIQVKWGDGSASKVSFSLEMNLHKEISSNLNVLHFFFKLRTSPLSW